MAEQTPLGPLGRGLAVLVLACVSLALPVPVRRSPAMWSPDTAARRAEAVIPAVGLPWGKLRGWQRGVDGWYIVWQPAHGSWLINAWVPDGIGAPVFRLDAAPWLPGARLSQAAARALAGSPVDTGVARDRLARRDWSFGSRRVLGALAAGEVLPRRGGSLVRPWFPLLLGLLLAGAVARLLLPAFPDRSWRRAAVVAVIAWVPLAPWSGMLAGRAFASGVRPWITELAFTAVVLLFAGAFSVLVVRFPPIRGRPTSWWLLPCSLALGVLSGRLRPASWLADVAGLPASVVVLATLAVVGSCLVVMAGDGLRELLTLPQSARRTLLALLGVVVVLWGGAWLGPVLSCILVAARGRGEGSWLATPFVWGWIVGGLWASCWWLGAQSGALALLLLGWFGVGMAAVCEWSAARVQQSR